MSRAADAILSGAARLVPRDARAEWLEEWQSELCYLRLSGGRPLRFCLGAIPDAIWMWRNVPGRARRTALLDSPVHCLMFLVGLLGLSLLLAFRLPDARALFLPFPYRDVSHLVLISPPGHFQERYPTVPLEDYRLIARQMDAAFYRPAKARVSVGGRSARLSVALAGGKLFALLGRPIAGPALVLAESAAGRYFGGRQAVAGDVADVNGRKLPIAAVILDDFWRLPGHVDAWLIESDAELAGLPGRTVGYVLGRTRNTPESWRWDLFVPNAEGNRRRFECTALNHQQPVVGIVIVLATALVMLPFLYSWQRGDYPHGTTSPRRWAFLLAKTVLIVPTVYFATFDIACVTVLGLQAHGMFIGFLLAFRWVLADQRRRCPVCLRLLTNPIRIGRPSQTFLEGWGTELMCGQGHGLLRVPEMPESSSSTQSWLTLEQDVFV